MNPDSTPPSRDQLEAGLTALLLGELPPDQAADLRRALEQDPALAALHQRLKLTIELVRETAGHAANEAPPLTTPVGRGSPGAPERSVGGSQAEPSPLPAPRLSEERRQELLAHFKTVAPAEFRRPRRLVRPVFAVSAIAAMLVGLLALTLFPPNFVRARAMSKRKSEANFAYAEASRRHAERSQQRSVGQSAQPAPPAPSLAPDVAARIELLTQAPPGRTTIVLPSLAETSQPAPQVEAPVAALGRAPLTVPGPNGTAAQPAAPTANQTATRTFPLQHADPYQMADQLAQLFPQRSQTDSASPFGFRFDGFGGSPGSNQSGNERNLASREDLASWQATGLTPGRNWASRTASKKMGDLDVTVGSDNHSITVTAPATLLPHIEQMVTKLDISNRHEVVKVFDLASAKPEEVQQILQDLFQRSGTPRPGNRSALLGTGNPLIQRSTESQSNNAGTPDGGVSPSPQGTMAGRHSSSATSPWGFSSAPEVASEGQPGVLFHFRSGPGGTALPIPPSEAGSVAAAPTPPPAPPAETAPATAPTAAAPIVATVRGFYDDSLNGALRSTNSSPTTELAASTPPGSAPSPPAAAPATAPALAADTFPDRLRRLYSDATNRGAGSSLGLGMGLHSAAEGVPKPTPLPAANFVAAAPPAAFTAPTKVAPGYYGGVGALGGYSAIQQLNDGPGGAAKELPVAEAPRARRMAELASPKEKDFARMIGGGWSGEIPVKITPLPPEQVAGNPRVAPAPAAPSPRGEGRGEGKFSAGSPMVADRSAPSTPSAQQAAGSVYNLNVVGYTNLPLGLFSNLVVAAPAPPSASAPPTAERLQEKSIGNPEFIGTLERTPHSPYPAGTNIPDAYFSIDPASRARVVPQLPEAPSPAVGGEKARDKLVPELAASTYTVSAPPANASSEPDLQSQQAAAQRSLTDLETYRSALDNLIKSEGAKAKESKPSDVTALLAKREEVNRKIADARAELSTLNNLASSPAAAPSSPPPSPQFTREGLTTITGTGAPVFRKRVLPEQSPEGDLMSGGVSPTTRDDLRRSLLKLSEDKTRADQALLELERQRGANDPEVVKLRERTALLQRQLDERTSFLADLNQSASPAVPTAADAQRKLSYFKRLRDNLEAEFESEGVSTNGPRDAHFSIIEAVRPLAPAPGTAERLREALFGKPEQMAHARVVLGGRQLDTQSLSNNRQPSAAFDSEILKEEGEAIRSDKEVLHQVVQDLNLSHEWANKYGHGKDLTLPETLRILKQKLDVSPVKGTSILDIGVKSDEPNEAARIANAVAQAYAQLRTQKLAQIHGGAASLQAARDLVNSYIAETQAELDRLAQSSPPAAPTNPPVETDLPVLQPAAPAPIPQPEVQTRENAFSTFSLNVSDVSFKLAAASLEQGTLPEPASVRTEEFINAFDYRDPEAPPGVPVAFAFDRARYPFAHNRDLLRFSLKTAAQGREQGRPLNVVLLLDTSGSMERADRVRIVREALRVLAGQLGAQDKLSVVTFARTPRLWVDGIPGSQAGPVAEAVSGITPEGGTNLEEALNLAYQTALRHYLANGINRVVLLTDGAANLGNVEPEVLKQKVQDHRRQGIALDCFGVGWEDYNDDLLEVLSRNADGRYGFLNSPEEAAAEFAGQLAGALRVAASDVKVQVEFNPARVRAYRQMGYAKHQLTKEQFRDNSVPAAQIGAAESGNALYVIETDPRGEGPLGTVRVRYRLPGTGDYREQEWTVPYTGTAPPLERTGPALRLAAAAAAFSESLADSPFAADVTPNALLGCLRGVPEAYSPDTRPAKLDWMIRQAQRLEGK